MRLDCEITLSMSRCTSFGQRRMLATLYHPLRFTLALPIRRSRTLQRLGRASFSTGSQAHGPFEQDVIRRNSIKIPVRASGNINLNIVYPKMSGPSIQSVIVYLPPRPFLELNNESEGTDKHAIEDGSVAASVLAARTQSIVVTVDYRLGKAYDEKYPSSPTNADELLTRKSKTRCFQYPTPVHDTLGAFDWIMRQLRPRTLAVCGSQIGGSLGAVLALTEPRSISAVALANPICNWVSLDDWCFPDAKSANEHYDKVGHMTTTAPSDLVPLLEYRNRLFKKPSHYFDPFASPMLFLRSAGYGVPPSIPRYFVGPDYPIPVPRPPPEKEAEAFFDAMKEDIESSNGENNEIPLEFHQESNTMSKPLQKRKIRLSKWAAIGMDFEKVTNQADVEPLEFPRTDVIISKSTRPSVLAYQGRQMVRALQNGCFDRHQQAVAEKKVRLGIIRPSEHPVEAMAESMRKMLVRSRETSANL